MSVSQNAAYAYSLFKNVKKIRTYGKLVKESVDEDTRSGALMKLGIRGMLEIAGNALGTSLTSHPYSLATRPILRHWPRRSTPAAIWTVLGRP